MLELEFFEPDIVLSKQTIEFLLGDKFPNEKMWNLFQLNFVHNFLLKNKILLEQYAEEVSNEYSDTISRLDETLYNTPI
jgi:hypothetical protein